MNNTSSSWLRALAAAGLVGMLGACATGGDAGNMSVATGQSLASPFRPAFAHAMCVRSITGGEATNPLWASKVDDQNFRTALVASLESAGLLSSNNQCNFNIDVNLLGLSQPTLGFDMEVTSHINYKVFGTDDRQVLLETISAPYTAQLSESVVGFVRLKRANEGSIRNSIAKFLDKLRAPTTS